jgi:hypothetical protein
MDDGGAALAAAVNDYDNRLDDTTTSSTVIGLIFSPFGRDFIVVITTQILFFIGGITCSNVNVHDTISYLSIWLL